MADLSGSSNRNGLSRCDPVRRCVGQLEPWKALRIATYNNAFATWEEKVKGSIEPGKLADFLVLSCDFMTVPEDDILKLHREGGAIPETS
jgi:predicted amidohydrolase YtcJ